MGPQDSPAIILSDCGSVLSTLSYKDVITIRNLITEFLSNQVKEKYHCIGLEMNHNIYIPSIIMSLQELQHAFIFLPDKNESVSIINDLGLMWSLSFISGINTVAVLSLNEQKLALNKHQAIGGKNNENILYVIRTSGSTGEPKFVRVTKDSIWSNITDLSQIFKIEASDTIYFGTPLTFDPSIIELLLAIENGACLLITTPKNQINPLRLYQTLFHPENGVTVLQTVPSLFQRWTETQIEAILLNPKLKILAFGGEQFPLSILTTPKSQTLRIFNLYGITEVSCWSSIYEITENLGEVPIGSALNDTTVELRDDSGMVIESGEGEIFIGSSTRICFVDDESNCEIFRATGDIGIRIGKEIFYKGRKNDIFKRFGHKINLSKIEKIIFEEVGLRNVCVWSKSQAKLLLFFLQDFDKNTKNKVLDKVRIKLLHSLPKQYFPDFIDIIRKCPITSHGKTDKNKLESIYLNRSKDKQPIIDVFKTQISKYFGIELSPDLGKLNFFELGGNSILAIQFLSEFEDELGGTCPDLVTNLFENDLNTCIKILQNQKLVKKRPQAGPSIQKAKKICNTGITLKVAWKYNLEACVDSTPLIFTHNGRSLVAIGSFSHIFAVLEANSGLQIAKFILPDVIESTPCYFNNFLYVTCFDGNLYCLDFTDNLIKWTYKTNDRVKCTPITCQNNKGVVFGSYDRNIHCVNIADGTIIWKTFVSESVISRPLLQNEKLYVATISGTCLCLCETSGEVLWKYKTGSPIFGAPCALNDCILWPNVAGSVTCLTSNGRKLWEYDTGGHLYSSLVLWQKFVIFGSHNGTLHVIKEGSEVEFVTNLVDRLTTPGIIEDFIVVAGNSGRLFLVDFKGVLRGELGLPGEIFSSVVGTEGRVFVGCRDNNLYCVEIKNGLVRRDYSIVFLKLSKVIIFFRKKMKDEDKNC